MKQKFDNRFLSLLGSVGRGFMTLLAYIAGSKNKETNKESGTPDLQGVIERGPVNWSDADTSTILRIITEAVLEAKATEEVGAERYERSEKRKNMRNGYRIRKKVATPLGIVENVRVPRLRRGSLRVPWLSRRIAECGRLRELSGELFVRGISTRGIAAISELLFGSEVSSSTASRFNEALEEGYRKWVNEEIKDEIRYLFLDGIRLRVKRGQERCTEGVLVAMGITEHGERKILGFVWGPWESTERWRALLRQLCRRGLDPKKLDLVTVDGNAGLLRALREEWPEVPIQRCWTHKTNNIIAKTKNRNRRELAKDLREIREATTKEEAEEAKERFAKKWSKEEPEAVKTLEKDWEDMLTFLRVPSRHWKLVRSTNILERAFLELRRRFRNIPVMPTPKSAERLVYAQVQILNLRWKGKEVPRWREP